MDTTQMIITIITAIVGSGGIGAVVTAFVSAKKHRAEASILEQQVESSRKETEQKMNDYIRIQLKELSETHKQESDELRRQNRELGNKIADLNNRINELMRWIVMDNDSYRNWLENELRKLKPDIEFPKCRPAPGFTTNDSDDEHCSENDQ